MPSHRSVRVAVERQVARTDREDVRLHQFERLHGLEAVGRSIGVSLGREGRGDQR
ncbi:MAG: hypothetical protein WA304_03275 [Candidatus Cybelea sp.]